MTDNDVEMNTPSVIGVNDVVDDDLIDYDDDDLDLGATWLNSENNNDEILDDSVQYDADMQVCHEEATEVEEFKELASHIMSPIHAEVGIAEPGVEESDIDIGEFQPIQTPIDSTTVNEDILHDMGGELHAPEDDATLDEKQLGGLKGAIEEPSVSVTDEAKTVAELEDEFGDEQEEHNLEDVSGLQATATANGDGPEATEGQIFRPCHDGSEEDNTVGSQVLENPAVESSNHGTAEEVAQSDTVDEITWEDNLDTVERAALVNDDDQTSATFDGLASQSGIVAAPEETDLAHEQNGVDQLEANEAHEAQDRGQEIENGNHNEDVEPDNDFDAAEATATLAAFDEVEGNVQQDALVEADEAYCHADSDYPKIIVHYRGEEYPFFSSTSDGFFTETSILDTDINELFCALRLVLADEISKQELLVIQVDELGLEYVENNSVDASSQTSLGEIMTVFEVLAKNQDADHNRALYLYLFSRPCPLLRLDFLKEAAANGQGLDELARMFEAPMDNYPQIDEGDVAAAIYESECYHSSPHDDNDEGVEAAEEQAPEEVENHNDNSNPNELYGEIEETGADEEAASYHYEKDELQEQSGPTNAFKEVDIDNLNQMSEYAELTAAETEVDPNGAYENAALGDEAENDDVDDYDQNDGASITVHSQMEKDNEETSPPTADSSRTYAADNDDYEDELDIGADQQEGLNTTSFTQEGEDELTELDWREGPDEAETSQTSPAIKRARADDDLGDDDDKDVKRLRY